MEWFDSPIYLSRRIHPPEIYGSFGIVTANHHSSQKEQWGRNNFAKSMYIHHSSEMLYTSQLEPPAN